MLRWLRLRKTHQLYLESCRNIKEGRIYLHEMGGCRRFFLQALCPVPLLDLDDKGQIVYRALTWLEANCTTSVLDEKVIQTYHRLLFPSGPVSPGRYRTGTVSVRDSTVPRPLGQRVPALMKQLGLKAIKEQTTLDQVGKPCTAEVLTVATTIHQRIAFIHPFEDGNGRVARLAMNHVMRRYGQGYVILPPLSEAPDHFRALEEAHSGGQQTLRDYSERHIHLV